MGSGGCGVKVGGSGEADAALQVDIMLGGKAVEIDSSAKKAKDGALDQAKARFRDIVVPVAVPILAGPGSITTTLLVGIRAEQWSDR
ncbi:MAG: MarC family protein [Myxococcales bacterium]|nr:MarC family protein [Myxococcales bacterium]